jgi:hypothetical protein
MRRVRTMVWLVPIYNLKAPRKNSLIKLCFLHHLYMTLETTELSEIILYKDNGIESRDKPQRTNYGAYPSVYWAQLPKTCLIFPLHSVYYFLRTVKLLWALRAI